MKYVSAASSLAEEWQEEFQMLCDPQGCDLDAFGQLLDDESEEFC